MGPLIQPKGKTHSWPQNQLFGYIDLCLDVTLCWISKQLLTYTPIETNSTATRRVVASGNYRIYVVSSSNIYLLTKTH